jgi:hypothetical protein
MLYPCAEMRNESTQGQIKYDGAWRREVLDLGNKTSIVSEDQPLLLRPIISISSFPQISQFSLSASEAWSW